MKFKDLVEMSLGNLRRRKLRTFLTVLGVVIGTASVVIMLSLGIGLKNMTEELYSSFGSMTAVTVYTGYQSEESENKYLTDDVLEEFNRLPHVKYSCPQLQISVILKQGIYECRTELKGVDKNYFKEVELANGHVPETGELGLVMGNLMRRFFTNTKTGKGYWETQIMPDIDYSKPLFVIYDADAYYESQNPSSEGESKKAPKKYINYVSGEIAGGEESYGENAFSVLTDIDALKAQLKTIFKKNLIPGQPKNKKGKPFNYFCYESIVVYCDDMDSVTTVQKQITDMGYQASSNMEWLEQSQQQSNLIQAVLGGIGAISLLVAAIGIANTMMMSIYERTKEIGIMKVLGCDMDQIRNMFLIESGFIGLGGGVIGVGISYIVSFLLNHLGMSSVLTGMEGQMSQIPIWLSFAAVAFAILVGMTAGFFPAIKAMKLSPLAAIRNE